MRHVTLGKIAVPTPGTPVRVTTDETLEVHCLQFTQIPGAVGKTSIKNAAGAIFQEMLPAGSTGKVDYRCFESNGGNRVKPADFYVDAATANEGLYVTYSVS
jgi:hypothetical protein